MAWTPPSLPDSIVLLGGESLTTGDSPPTAEILPGEEIEVKLSFPSGGGTFPLKHSGENSCVIPDGETLILTGGKEHTYVTR